MTESDLKDPGFAEALVDYVDSMRKLEKEGVVTWDDARMTWVYAGTDKGAPLMLNPDLLSDNEALD